jgi:hypothetical protein
MRRVGELERGEHGELTGRRQRPLHGAA